jgi:RsiW-degrading membrane proteinase PrsW (M82 family)
MLAAIILYSSLLLCALLIARTVWKYDLYDHEPLHTLLFATLAGAGLMWLAGVVQVGLLQLQWHHAPEYWGNVSFSVFAGVTEEIAKLGAVAMIVIIFPRVFNDPMDGIIYGAFAGLGAAILESVLHLGFTPPTARLPGQEPIRLMGHLVFGGIGGFGLGLRTIHAPYWRVRVLLSLFAAITLHALWDIVAFYGDDYYREHNARAWWQIAASFMLMLGGMILFRWLVARGARLSKVVFSPKLTPGQSPATPSQDSPIV